MPMLRVRAPATMVEHQPFAALSDGARRDGPAKTLAAVVGRPGARAPWLVQRQPSAAMRDPSPVDTKVHTFG